MALAAHLFASSVDGALYDTRSPDWSKRMPLRQTYTGHIRPQIDRAAEVKAALRAGAWTDVGGYPLYFVTADGAALSFDAVRQNLRSVLEAIRDDDRRGGWRVVGVSINYEEADLVCEHTGKAIPSAYGEA